MRYAVPSPYREVPHTADAGIEADGATLEEALSRVVLGMAQEQAGGGPLAPALEREIHARGADAVELLVDLCRQVLDLFFRERLLLCALEHRSSSGTEVLATASFARFDPAQHAEGWDIKSVTYGGARVDERGGRWTARVIFDL